MTAPLGREDVRQTAYAAWRACWKRSVERWLDAGRPEFFEIEIDVREAA